MTSVCAFCSGTVHGMEETPEQKPQDPQSAAPVASEPVPRHRVVRWTGPQPVRAILVKRAKGLPRPAAALLETPAPAAPPVPMPIYPFIPYPVELAEMERRRALPAMLLRLLALRRFAHPLTGEWITTTREVAQLIGADRTTAQKVLRTAERAQYMHIRDARTRRVHRVITFGGFSDPEYRSEGKPPLRWDTANGTPSAQPTAQSSVRPHTAPEANPGFEEPKSASAGASVGTVPVTNNERRVRSNKYNYEYEHDDEHEDGRSRLLPVENFQPQSHDESVIQELAQRLGEQYMNSFLALRRTYGLAPLQRACGLARDKLQDTQYPLRERPGAYVRWLLRNGKCGPS